VLTLTFTYLHGILTIILVINAAIRFNNLEWTGATSVAAGLPNQGRQSQITEINREPLRSEQFTYQNVAAARKGTEDYNMALSDYYMPLTNPNDLDPLTSDWTFSLVRSLTTTLATANSTKDPLNPTQNIVDFYKPAYNAANWPGVAVPSSFCVQGIGPDGKPYTGYYDPDYGYDPPYYVNTQNPQYLTIDGERQNIFSGVSIPGAPNQYNPVGFYRRTFDVPEQWITDKNKVSITLNGAEAAFYLDCNGMEVGYHCDSKTPGDFDLTPFLNEDGKNNLLAVKVFRWATCSWLDVQDMIRMGGICRDVYLTAKPAVHIRDFKVETRFDSSYENATLFLRTDIRNSTTAAQDNKYAVVAQLLDENGVDILKDRTIKELCENKVYRIAAGFLPSGGAANPQECYVPFKDLPRRMAAKRQGKM